MSLGGNFQWFWHLNAGTFNDLNFLNFYLVAICMIYSTVVELVAHSKPYGEQVVNLMYTLSC